MIYTEKDYVKLSDSLPLEAPFTLMIDPTNICNFKCTFCPTGDAELLKSVNRPKGMMSFELYSKIIDDLTEFPTKIRSLRLFKDGEPFANKNMVRMLQYARQKEVANEIYIISNGSLITNSVADAILDAGLDRLRISVEHVSSEKYKEVTRTYSDYNRILENIRYLYEQKKKRNIPLFINAKIVDTGLTPEEIVKFRADWGPISDEQTIETLMGWSTSVSDIDRDFTLDSNPETGIDSKSQLAQIEVCPEPFKGMAINFDGSVSICCVDWSHGTVVGDAQKESVVSIWNGPKMHAFRMHHLKKEREKIRACSSCQYLKGHKEISHLDDSVEELIKKYNQRAKGGSYDISIQQGMECDRAGRNSSPADEINRQNSVSGI